MNKYQDALYTLTDYFHSYVDANGVRVHERHITEEYEKAKETLQKLVNRETPKPIKLEKDGIGDSDAFGGTGSLTYYVAECPHCESELNDTSASYCQYCGQRLDWGDDDEQ